VIDYMKANSTYYYIITTGKLNADWSNKEYLQHNKSCNKVVGKIRSINGVLETEAYQPIRIKWYEGWLKNEIRNKIISI